MNYLILLDEIILACCWVICIFIAAEFYTSKNGGLRLFLIWIFGMHASLWFSLAIFILFYNRTSPLIAYIPFMAPLAVVKILFYNFIKNEYHGHRTTTKTNKRK